MKFVACVCVCVFVLGRACAATELNDCDDDCIKTNHAALLQHELKIWQQADHVLGHAQSAGHNKDDARLSDPYVSPPTNNDRPIWHKLVKPADCVSGRTEEDSQTCHSDNLKALVTAHFAGFQPASVTQSDFDDVLETIASSGMSLGKDVYEPCCVVQVINNSVWVAGGCILPHTKISRIRTFASLLQHAASLPDIGLIPDVEMHVCTDDEAALVLGSHRLRAPVLTAASLPEARGRVIPVPLNANFQVAEGYSNTCLGLDLSIDSNTIAGKRRCLPHQIPWENKKPVAFFRGKKYEDAPEACSECKCTTADNLCHSCHQNCTPSPDHDQPSHLGLPCARPRARTHCLREDLMASLQGKEGFDVGSDRVEECLWELNQYLLVIGNNLGWADRLQASLFKTSATILVDSGAYEWFYPLMIEDLHFIRANASASSVLLAVKTALERDDKDMVQRANAFAQLAFGLDNAARYAAYVAQAYSRVQVYRPQKRAASDGVSASRLCEI